jgi:hypothetical protein
MVGSPSHLKSHGRLAAAVADPGARLKWLRIVIGSGFIAGLLLSPKLWLSSRSYPLAPISDLLSPVPFPLDYVWFVALLALLCAVILGRRPRPYLVAFLLFMGFYTLWDQARWTPWVYQYTAILAVLSFLSPGSADKRREAVLNTCRAILAATYFWAGLQKINISFIRRGFPWLVRPLVGGLPDAFRGWPYPLGLGAALLEATIGVGLLVPASRPAAVLAAAGMHLFILLVIGPFGHRWDSLVWPWNVTMGVSAGLLFWKAGDTTLRATLCQRTFVAHYAVLLLFGIMPALNFLDAWDANFSAALYSANIKQAVVYVDEDAKDQLPAEAQGHLNRSGGGQLVLNLFRWSVDELNVEPYPEERAYKAVARRLCRLTREGAGLTLVIYGRPGWRDERRSVARYTCREVDSRRGLRLAPVLLAGVQTRAQSRSSHDLGEGDATSLRGMGWTECRNCDPQEP